MIAAVVLSTDLMDRSKLSAAFPDAVFVRSAGEAIERAGEAEVVVVDLRRVEAGDLGALVERAGRVIAFGSHVDDEMLATATTAGAEALPRSLFFRRLANGEF